MTASAWQLGPGNPARTAIAEQLGQETVTEESLQDNLAGQP
jgi:hypothetical protein